MTNFDERAKDWDSDPKKVERARAVAEAIRKAIPLTANMSALEYGCGTGLLSFALQSDSGTDHPRRHIPGNVGCAERKDCRLRRDEHAPHHGLTCPLIPCPPNIST